MLLEYFENHRKHKETIERCCGRLEEISGEIRTTNEESLKKLRAEADVIAKEISAIRLIQGYDRIINSLVIAVVSAVGGGGLLVVILKILQNTHS